MSHIVADTNDKLYNRYTVCFSKPTGAATTCIEAITIAPAVADEPHIYWLTPSCTIEQGQRLELLCNGAVDAGNTATFQWYNGSTPIAGATNYNYFPPTTAAGTTIYHCVVTATKGVSTKSKTSDDVTVTVTARADLPTPTITRQPANISVRQGDVATLQVVATPGQAGHTLYYQWYAGSAIIPGATMPSLDVATTTVGQQQYHCVVTEADGLAATSSAATVTVAAPQQQITVDITPKTQYCTMPATPAQALTATAATTANATFTYQWYRNTQAASSGGTAIAGANSSTYTAPAADCASSQYRYYYCVVSAGAGFDDKASPVATVVVRPKKPSLSPNWHDQQDPTREVSKITTSVADGCTLALAWSNTELTQNQLTDGTHNVALDANNQYTSIPQATLQLGTVHFYAVAISAAGIPSELVASDYNLVECNWHTVKFARGNTDVQGTLPDDIGHLARGWEFTVPECNLTWAGHTFTGWAYTKDGTLVTYQPGQVVAFPEYYDITLTAQWEARIERTLYDYEPTKTQPAVSNIVVTGGLFTSTKGAAGSQNAIKIDFASGPTAYIRCDLNTPLATGDKIRLTLSGSDISSTGASTLVVASAPTAGTAYCQQAITTKDAGTYTIDVPASAVGATTLYLRRGTNNTSVYLHHITVLRTTATASADATLASVCVNGHNLTPAIAADGTRTYTYHYGHYGNKTALAYTLTAADQQHATIAVDGGTPQAGTLTTNLTFADHLATITAENGTQRTDTIRLIRAEDIRVTSQYRVGGAEDLYYEAQSRYIQDAAGSGNDVYCTISPTAGMEEIATTKIANKVRTHFTRAINPEGAATPQYDHTTGVPTAGMYYIFQMKTRQGVTNPTPLLFRLPVVLMKNKPLISSNGQRTAIAGQDIQYDFRDKTGATVAMSGNTLVTDDDYCTGVITLIFKPGATYYIYADGSTLQLQGWDREDLVQYNVHAAATAGGSITTATVNGVDQAADITSTAGYTATAGDHVVITATAEQGKRFAGWKNTDGQIVQTVKTLDITSINAAVNLTAVFTDNTFQGLATFTMADMRAFGCTEEGTNSEIRRWHAHDDATTSDKYIALTTSTIGTWPTQGPHGCQLAHSGTNRGEFVIAPIGTGVVIKQIDLVTESNTKSLPARYQGTTNYLAATGNGVVWTYPVRDNRPVQFLNTGLGENYYIHEINVVYEYTDSDPDSRQLRSTFTAGATVRDYINTQHAAPALTVTLDGELSNNHTEQWAASNTAIATVDQATGLVTLVAEGATTIVAKSNDGTNEPGYAYFYAIAKPLNVITVEAADLTMMSNDKEYDKPVPVVRCGDELVPPADYTLTYTITAGTNVTTINGATSIAVLGEPQQWHDGTATVHVTATLTADAQQRLHATATAETSYNVTVNKAGGKMTPAMTITSPVRLNIGSTLDVAPVIMSEGRDISEYFNAGCSGTTPADATDIATIGAYNGKGRITAAGTGTATFHITATPKTDYEVSETDGGDKVYASDLYNAPQQVDLVVIVEGLNTFGEATALTPANATIEAGTTLTPTLNIYASDGTTIPAAQCKLTWSTDAPAVATVDKNGTITAGTQGTAVIRVAINADGYETRTVQMTLTVTDGRIVAVATAEDNDVREAGTHYTTADGLCTMVLGGWMFKRDGTDGKAYTPFDKAVTSEAVTYKWSKPYTERNAPAGFKYDFRGGDMKNPRAESGNNSMAASDSIYNATIQPQTQLGNIIDKMFGVPATGAYLVFMPKTNGTVTAHIYQKGVLDLDRKDNKLEKAIYRPQKRVFIVDEQNNFVPSKATYRAASAQMTTYKDADGKNAVVTDLSQYGANLTGRLAAGTGTAAGIQTDLGLAAPLVIAADGKLAPNVYECHIANDIMHTATLYDPATATLQGAAGWSTICDGPVDYEFHAQAGKTYYLYNYTSKLGVFGFEFHADSVAVDHITLNDNTRNAPRPTAPGHVARITSNRTFTGGMWNAVCLPYSLSKEKVDAIFGKAKDYANEQGTEIIYFEDVTEKPSYPGTYVVNFVRHAYNDIVAGKPCLIKPSKAGTITITEEQLGNVTIESSAPSLWGRDTKYRDRGYKWKAGYSYDAAVVANEANAKAHPELLIRQPGDLYAGRREGTDAFLFIQPENKYTQMKAFRGFLQPQTPEARANARAARFELGGMLNDLTEAAGVPTAISFIPDATGAFQQVPDTGTVYNTQGQAVAATPQALRTLPAGVYIVAGKRYTVQ